MSRFDDDLCDVPHDRRTAARWFLRADYAAGRVISLQIAAVLALASLVFFGFAAITFFTDGLLAALKAAALPMMLAVASIVVARRRPRRFTDMELS